MRRLTSLVLALLAAPAFAKDAKTAIGVSCVVVSSSLGAQTDSIITTRSCGEGCILKVTQY